MKTVFLAAFDAILGFIIWMNVTPGHFQSWNNCGLPEYIEVNRKVCLKAESEKLVCYCQKTCASACAYDSFTQAVSTVLLIMSKLDYYR